MRLHDKSALILGGTSGIGEASAEAFAREGARVTIVGRGDAGKDVVDHIVKAGGEASFIRSDVSKTTDICKAIDQHVAKYTTIDILFNNASKGSDGKSVVDTSEEEFDKVMTTNFKSVFMSCKYAAPFMMKAGRGSIINTTAASAREGLAWPGIGAYVGSKGAVIAFTRALAVELAPFGIRVNSLNPGIVDTPMLRSFCAGKPDPDAFWRSLGEAQLLKRVGSPSELANAAVFLASDEASYITGTDILVDGGLVLG
jgi:NAD(P)-dependent dehydrogenase (short-subunit alcohol dehydrogenase family)